MFEMNTAVTTSVAIYPNNTDTWHVSSPFGEVLSGGEGAFVFSTSKKIKDSSLHLVRGRLVDVGKYSNSIDFLFKTYSEQKTKVAETSGIGGISKLKDFNFTILRSGMSVGNVISLYGRTIILFLSSTNSIERIDNVDKSKIVFKGKVHSIKIKDEELVVTVRGLLDSANPLIGGTVVQASNNSIVNESIVFGDAGDMYISIPKKEVDGKLSLQFSQDDKFIIKGLYVKTGSGDEPVFGEINTPFSVVNKEIVFENEKQTSITLQSTLHPLPIANRIARIILSNTFEIGIKLIYETPILPLGTVCHYYRDGVKKPNRLIYKRVEVVDSDTLYIFPCGWNLI